MTANALIQTQPVGRPAPASMIRRVVCSLEANRIRVMIAEDDTDARSKVSGMLPPGAGDFLADRRTLTTPGITVELDGAGGQPTHLRELAGMDPELQRLTIKQMCAAPVVLIGSAYAVTEVGGMLIVGMTGAELAGCLSGMAHIIWLVRTRNIVATMEDGLRLVANTTPLLQDARAAQAAGQRIHPRRLLMAYKEFAPDRTTVILVKDAPAE